MGIIISSLVGNSVTLLLNPIFHFVLLILSIIVSGIIIRIYLKRIEKKDEIIAKLQQQHVAKIDIIRKEHVDKINELNREMLKKEEDRSRQWQESEKETMLVLNGISQLLELSESINRIDSEKIINKLEEIKEIVEKKSK